MARSASMFSESWFRVSGQRVALRPHVRVFRQRFRGERWHVLHDPFNNNFFRIRPASWEFLARLDLGRTIESVWNECQERDPIEAPGQEEALRLLAQLYNANLLHSTMAPDTARLFERYRRRRSRETRAYLQNIMFARIPLIDPDAFLKRLMPVARAVFSIAGAVVWLGVVAVALKVVVDNASALWSASEGILAPSNLVWLYLGLVVVKTVHEFGHAFACRRFGGEVHTMGLMFLLFTPVPYMDATAAWSFKSRWQRALVGAAGMIVEIFVAALATFVWATTSPGVVNSLAYNMMFVASVSTLLFNANPLLRFDGYYILSDLLDIPNLHQRATGQMKHVVERHVFGVQDSQGTARSRREAGWLGVFAVSSHIYRLFLFAAILLFLADRFLVLGLIMTVVCVISWILVPLFKFAGYLAASPRLVRCRRRAVGAVAATVATLIVVLGVVPFPNRFRAPAVVSASEHTVVVAEAPGWVREVISANGAQVRKGDPLFRQENPELELDIAAVRAQIEETKASELRALRMHTADLAPIESRLAALDKTLRRLLDRREALLVRAPHDGLWVAPDLADGVGAWLRRGQTLGQLVNDAGGFEARAVVPQSEVSRLFEGNIRRTEARFPGQSELNIMIHSTRIIPADRRTLPTPALGWRAGGTIPVAGTDEHGTRATEAFFEVRAPLPATDGVALMQGRSGWLRFTLPPEPLLQQWMRRLWQLLQKRYGL